MLKHFENIFARDVQDVQSVLENIVFEDVHDFQPFEDFQSFLLAVEILTNHDFQYVPGKFANVKHIEHLDVRYATKRFNF